jgi:hypothetical protein
MNRLRIRVGEKVREFKIDFNKNRPIIDMEPIIHKNLHSFAAVVPVRLVWLKDYSWDIFIEDRRIGHAKAWQEPDKSAIRQLRSWLWLFIVAYLALC